MIRPREPGASPESDSKSIGDLSEPSVHSHCVVARERSSRGVIRQYVDVLVPDIGQSTARHRVLTDWQMLNWGSGVDCSLQTRGLRGKRLVDSRHQSPLRKWQMRLRCGYHRPKDSPCPRTPSTPRTTTFPARTSRPSPSSRTTRPLRRVRRKRSPTLCGRSRTSRTTASVRSDSRGMTPTEQRSFNGAAAGGPRPHVSKEVPAYRCSKASSPTATDAASLKSTRGSGTVTVYLSRRLNWRSLESTGAPVALSVKSK
jgi:hypothetical protein